MALSALAPAGEEEPIGLVSTVCFAEGTTDEYVAEAHAAFGLPEYDLASRWSGNQGDPRALTWSFVPDGLTIPGNPSDDSELFSRLDAQFSGQGGRATWIQRFQEVFDRWEELTGLDFTRVTPGGNDWDDGASWSTASGSASRGDIRIGMRSVDGGSNVLAYASYPGSGNGGNIVFDRAEGWGDSTGLHVFLRNVAAHEAGHAVGIQHVCSSNSYQLMKPFVSTVFDGPLQDDIRAAQRHYGDPFEQDNSIAVATDLGILASSFDVGALPPPLSGPVDPDAALLSLDADGESDYFELTIATPLSVSVTLTPVGSTYQDEQQNGDGSCPGRGNSVNALAVTNLNLQVRNAANAVLATADTQPAGVAEAIQSLDLGTPGSYFVRVYESGAPGQAQIYRFAVTSIPYFPGFCNAADGSHADCPCGNAGGPESGCDISQGTGGVRLDIVMQQTLQQNRVTVQGSGFPAATTPTAVVIRGSDLDPASPVVFGDGLRCVGAPLVRLGAGTANFGLFDQSFGHGAGAGSGSFYYQLWFRNTPIGFCDPGAAFNLSSGRTLLW